MKTYLLAAASLLAFTGAAAAADLPDQFIEPVATVIAPTWTGAYIGAFAGYAFKGDDGNSILFDTNLDGVFGDIVPGGPTGNAFAPGFCDGTANGSTPAFGCDEDEGGFTGSIRAGYDVQFGQFVVGGLIEAAYVDLEDATTAFSVTPTFYTIERDLDYTVAARLRAGFAADRLLAYVTGGAVYGDMDYSFDTGNTVNTFALTDGDDGDIGYQLGGGIEVMLTDKLSLSGEYLYTRFEDSDVRVRAGGAVVNPFTTVNALGTDFKLADEDFDYHTVHLGVNYRF